MPRRLLEIHTPELKIKLWESKATSVVHTASLEEHQCLKEKD